MTDKLKKLIEYDIQRCRKPMDADESEELFNEFISKYTVIDKNMLNEIGFMPRVEVLGTRSQPDYRSDLKKLAARLEMMLALEDENNTSHLLEEQANDLAYKEDKEKVHTKNKVFIVHGHDKEAKIETARTLEQAGFEAIILHEQPDTGDTIIEKIEKYTNVSYAIVLYTPCDLGRAKENTEDRYRARQNVVFEHGYLMGKLGRNCVAALVKGDIETPGDLGGMVYIPMDKDGFWKVKLARSMKAVNLDFDLNNII